MRVNEAYKLFLSKMNESSTSRNIAVNRGKFSILFNKSLLEIVKEYLSRKYTDEVDYIEGLLVVGKDLNSKTINKDYQEFSLPEEFLEYDLITAVASNDAGCQDNIELIPVKGRETSIILNDDFNKPSFFYRTAPFRLLSNSVRIYREGFEIDQVNIDYYKYPREVVLENSSDPESKFIDFEFEVGKDIIYEAIDRTIIEYSLSVEDYNKLQAQSGINKEQKQLNK